MLESDIGCSIVNRSNPIDIQAQMQTLAGQPSEIRWKALEKSLKANADYRRRHRVADPKSVREIVFSA